MDNLLNDPNPWILNICSGVIVAVLSKLLQQRLRKRHSTTSQETYVRDQPAPSASIQTSVKEAEGTSKTRETLGSCLGIIAYTAGFLAFLAAINWVQDGFGNAGTALLCVPILILIIILFVMTLREEGLL